MPIVSEKPPPGPLTARPVQPSIPDNPLTEAHFQALRRAAAARRPIRKAAGTARFSALTMLLIGLASFPVTLVSLSWLGALTVTGICILGVCELVGSIRMRRGLVSAASFLGRNQLLLLALITAYSIIQMVTLGGGAMDSALGTAELQSELAQLKGQGVDLSWITTWTALAIYGFYGLVIGLSVCFQGGLAMYYFTRGRYLRALQQDYPPWVHRVFSTLEG